MLRILYIALPCSNPDWDGTATEGTRTYLAATLPSSRVDICYVRVPSLPSWRRHKDFNQCAIVFMLCQFGRRRNVYVATTFILLSSTAESSATSGYVAAPEHFLQNEEPACINEERTKKKPSFVPKVD